MPKLTLLLGRKTLQVLDLKKDVIQIGREEERDVVIDNPSVSRKHAEIRLSEDGTWMLRDLGSSNGTFLRGERIDGPRPLKLGDEIGFGKFSLLFGKAVGGGEVETAVHAAPAVGVPEGTMHIKSHEVKELLEGSERERRAHLLWESGGQRGKHYLSVAPAALIGTGELCDVKVPRAPKHHVLVMNQEGGCEVRNLHWWTSMTVRGRRTRRAVLKDGDVVEVGGLTLTFVDDIA